MKAPAITFSLALFFFVLSFSGAKADVKLPAVLSDNMVLQQDTRARIWGKAAPGEKITVSVSWSRKKQKTVAAADSSWLVEIVTPVASTEPGSLTVKGRNTVEIST